VLHLLRALRANGVRVVTWSPKQSREPDFSSEGLFPLALIAGLQGSREPSLIQLSPQAADLAHLPLGSGAPPTCTRLSDGTGVWVFRVYPPSGKVELYCPFRSPQFYPA
jgi:hypothetical protein